MLRREGLDRLRVLVQALAADKRDVVVLRFVAGLTVGEIAAVIGKGEAATRKQLARTGCAPRFRVVGERRVHWDRRGPRGMLRRRHVAGRLTVLRRSGPDRVSVWCGSADDRGRGDRGGPSK